MRSLPLLLLLALICAACDAPEPEPTDPLPDPPIEVAEPSQPSARPTVAGAGDEPPPVAEGQRLLRFEARGMRCDGCVKMIYRDLLAIEGVEDARVSLKRGLAWAVVGGSGPSAEAIAAALAEGDCGQDGLSLHPQE